MMTNPATVASNPARDLSIRLWVWLSMHRRVSYVLAFLACCTICNLVLAGQAHATGQEGEAAVPIVGFPASGITDTHGVPISRYLELPFDSGNITHPVRSARYVIASLLWMAYAGPTIALLAMLDWILAFGWLEWIAAPFTLVANTLQELMQGIGLIGLAVAVTALAIAIGLLRGRRSSAWVELAMVIVMFGIIVTPLANPIQMITGEDGWVQTARDFGMEAGELTTPGGGETAQESNIVSGVIVDMTLRDPMLTMSWGSDLANNQECTDRWNHNALDDSNDAGDLRTEVNGCEEAAKAANETDSFLFLAPFSIGTLTALGVMFMAVVFLAFLLLAVVSALIGSVNVVIKGYFALFPGGGRYAFFNALAQTVLAVISIGIFIWLLIVYLWGIDFVASLFPVAGSHLGLLMGFLILAMALTFISLRIRGKKVGEAIARALGRNGLSGAAQPQRGPSAFKQGMTQALPSTAATAMRKLQRGRQLRRAAKLAAVAGTGGTAAAATMGTKALATKALTSKAVTRTASAAASAGSAAGTSATDAATRAQPRSTSRALPAGAREMSALESSAERTPASAAATVQTGEAPRGPEQGGPAARGDSVHEPSRPVVVGPAPAPAAALSSGPVEARTAPADGVERSAERRSASGAQVQARPGGTSWPAVATVPAPPQRRPAPPRGARATNLPPGRYGTVWVHANGTSTTVLSGPNTVPSERKVSQVWDITSPDVPVARSRHKTPAAAAAAPRVSAVAQSVDRQRHNDDQATAAPRAPRPMRKAGE